ncbi:PHA/PHB synthase family protein [Methylocapsa palsarum]|uniref:Polyhydroxyalkanoate synthase n=1 Tax=Methylocapsa palsarum TaxID=1612308 RepID=A0A1I4CKB5_9HYPH|nr:alpha/beta fold hydrolase [Methylocapsa palsarum]SFK81678.1 polyhydroxyalkanoate synthase [Methylocapsa palsarum]
MPKNALQARPHQTLAAREQRMFAAPASSAAEALDPAVLLDRLVHAAIGRLTSGLSPTALALAYLDWAQHLAISPGKQMNLVRRAMGDAARLTSYAALASIDRNAPDCIAPPPDDRRFRNDAWRRWPFNVISQACLMRENWWRAATSGVVGVSRHHENVVSFVADQILEAMSPANCIATNPEVLEATIRERGENLTRGARYWITDQVRAMLNSPPVGANAFRPGHEVAVTRGAVIYRNRLIELIQYSPTTTEVFAEPVLIVPAWIMKYYILDLSPSNSFVKYLVDRGHTVFIISWLNPTGDDRDLSMEDYVRLGLLDAVQAVEAIVSGRKIDAVGYCLGGTLLSIVAALLAGNGSDVFNSLTFLASQVDFTEAGPLTLFIDDAQISLLDDVMWDQGVLERRQMLGAFQLLQSNSLIWSHSISEYLLGQPAPMFDLMAWDADATRMPYRMHSEYLRSLFLNNDLFEGRFQVNGRPIALRDISAPIFSVATERDFIAPWRSVYKINLVTTTEVTFVLTSGGHNGGVVDEPGHPHRRYRTSHRPSRDPYVDPDRWYEASPVVEGSWWPALASWMEARSSGRVPPPGLGAPEKGFAPLCAAPGTYVLQA